MQPGWGVSQVGDELASKGVVGSALAFRLYVKVSGAGPFQAGTFTLRKDMGSRPAADVLERPAALTYRKLALIPGLTLDMIADRVGQLPGFSRDRFLQVAASNTVRSKFEPANVTSLEGLTWPDTYYVSKADTEETLLKTLVGQFDKEATKAGLACVVRPLPDGDHRVVDPDRGQARRGPPAHRGGGREPAARRHAAPDRRDVAVRGGVASVRSPTPTTTSIRRTTPTETAVFRRPRSRRSRATSLDAALHPGRTCRTSSTC